MVTDNLHNHPVYEQIYYNSISTVCFYEIYILNNQNRDSYFLPAMPVITWSKAFPTT